MRLCHLLSAFLVVTAVDVTPEVYCNDDCITWLVNQLQWLEIAVVCESLSPAESFAIILFHISVSLNGSR